MDFHSRLIGWLKIGLPLAALVILSTFFLLPSLRTQGDKLPYAEIDVESRLKEPRITAPSYAGVTANGTKIAFSAAKAVPSPDGTITATEVIAQFITPDGTKNIFLAQNALQNRAEKSLILKENVKLITSQGYQIEGNFFRIMLAQGEAFGQGPIKGRGPLGHFQAGEMMVKSNPSHPQEFILTFSRHITLTYTPPAR